MEGAAQIRLNMHRTTTWGQKLKLVSVFLSLSNVEWLYVLGARGKIKTQIRFGSNESFLKVRI